MTLLANICIESEGNEATFLSPTSLIAEFIIQNHFTLLFDTKKYNLTCTVSKDLKQKTVMLNMN